jgi:hypothetical protein
MPNFLYAAQYQSRSIIAMIVTRVVGNLRVPTKRSRDILQQAKGITLIKSTQIRWFSRGSSRGGWSGKAEAQQRPRVSKLRAKRLSDSHSSEIVVEAVRRGASEPKERATLTTCLLKKGELKSSSLFDRKRAKGSLPEKSTMDKKERLLTLNSGVDAEGRDKVDE